MKNTKQEVILDMSKESLRTIGKLFKDFTNIQGEILTNGYLDYMNSPSNKDKKDILNFPNYCFGIFCIRLEECSND